MRFVSEEGEDAPALFKLSTKSRSPQQTAEQAAGGEEDDIV